MRTTRTNKDSHPNQHTQYGVYNWFARKGIRDMEIIKEVLYFFCSKSGFEMRFIKNETKKFNWIQNRFSVFAAFAILYLKDNNYLS